MPDPLPLPVSGSFPYHAVRDPFGHPLTWGSVWSHHHTLMQYSRVQFSDDRRRLTPVYEDFVNPDDFDTERRSAIREWPGPICGPCWAASCRCGYVFEGAEEAAGREPFTKRLICSACMRR